MPFYSVWLIPVLATVFALAAFISGYSIAVGEKDAYAWFMYISDGGAKPPESCIFGQLLNLSAVFLALSCYIRHRQYVVYYGHRCGEKTGWWRTASLVLMYIGFLSAFGMSLVANFQEISILVVHDIGAMLAFFGATIYCWGQIFMSYALVPHMTPVWLNHIRTVLIAFSSGALVLHMTCQYAKPFVKSVNGVVPTESTDNVIKKYHSDSPFYTNHLVTTCAEWALALSLEAIVLTFAWELRQFYIHIPKLRIKQGPIVPLNADGTSNIVSVDYRTNGQISDPSIKQNEAAVSASVGKIPRSSIIRKAAPGSKRNEYLY